uniref:GTP-binding nuclear protein n=1 Tax=Panagrellus redivivus TaxID=6233 RepID=A0A7E4UM50_PANRE
MASAAHENRIVTQHFRTHGLFVSTLPISLFAYVFLNKETVNAQNTVKGFRSGIAADYPGIAAYVFGIVVSMITANIVWFSSSFTFEADNHALKSMFLLNYGVFFVVALAVRKYLYHRKFRKLEGTEYIKTLLLICLASQNAEIRDTCGYFVLFSMVTLSRCAVYAIFGPIGSSLPPFILKMGKPDFDWPFFLANLSATLSAPFFLTLTLALTKSLLSQSLVFDSCNQTTPNSIIGFMIFNFVTNAIFKAVSDVLKPPANKQGLINTWISEPILQGIISVLTAFCILLEDTFLGTSSVNSFIFVGRFLRCHPHVLLMFLQIALSFLGFLAATCFMDRYQPKKQYSRIPSDEVPTFKLILVGDGGIGKTTFVNRHLTAKLSKKYIAAVGAEVYTMTFNVNGNRKIRFDLWDTTGQEKVGGLRDNYFSEGQCAMIMFDVTSRTTYDNVPDWFKQITRVCGYIPTVIVGNKVDAKSRVVQPKDIDFHRNTYLQYYDISAKSNYNFKKPFLHLARKLFDDDDLEFEAEDTLALPDINIDKQMMIQYEQQLRECAYDDIPYIDVNSP